MKLPENGSTPEAVFSRMDEYRAHDLDWRAGKVWAYVFDPGEEAERVVKRAYMAYLSENGLDPTAFPSLVRFENEVVAMAIAHLSGDDQVVGSFTSGGTESILLAVKTARDWARVHRSGITAPNMVAPATVHAAFHKAAHYFNVGVTSVDVDPETFLADVSATEAAIDDQTIMLVGSAVSYAHCVVNPIVELAALAERRGLLMHVDACMGGFLLPYFRRLGRAVPDFDFAVPGVTSISMDLHKYAFAAKGASVVLYRDRALRRFQIFTCADWPGYTMSNPTIQSSKSGGPVAAAWAVMNHFGDSGYLELARKVLAGTERFLAFVDGHPELRALGRSDMNHVAFTSDTISVFLLDEALKKRGWYLQVQLSHRSSPANIHICLNPENLRVLEPMIADIEACIGEVRDKECSPLVGQMRALLSVLKLDKLHGELLRKLMLMAGISSGDLPEVGADINEILDALSPDLRERVLTEFMNELFIPAVEPHENR